MEVMRSEIQAVKFLVTPDLKEKTPKSVPVSLVDHWKLCYVCFKVQ